MENGCKEENRDTDVNCAWGGTQWHDPCLDAHYEAGSDTNQYPKRVKTPGNIRGIVSRTQRRQRVYLVYRTLEAADIEPGLALAAEDYAEDPDITLHVAKPWRRLLAAGMLNGMVLEDLTWAPGERLAAFGMSAFVSPEFMAEARRGETPGLAALVAHRLGAGDAPVLSPDAVRRANSGPGLNLLVLHYAEASALPEMLQGIRDKQVETFFYVHGGYRYAEMLVEHRSEHLRQFALESGFRVRSEYGAYYRSHARPPGECPALFGITREETLPHPGLHVARLFVYTPPRFYFKPREQALLWHALLDKTDEEMAAALGVTTAAVKKRWVGIYDRAADIAPALFPDSLEAGPAHRGQEKRRHLMRYLRLHPEEMRPAEEAG